MEEGARPGAQVVSLETGDAETRFSRGPARSLTPEKRFEQNRALAVLDAVYRELQREYEVVGRKSCGDD